jgi:hypothetical protein
MPAVRLSLVALVCLSLAACQSSTPNPVAPGASSGGGPAANADGSTLKATIPVAVSPLGRAVVETLRPDLVFTNATARFGTATFTYRVELYRENVKLTEIVVAQAAGAQTTAPVPSDLEYETLYRWRVRPELNTAFGSWSLTADFLTMPRPRPAPGAGVTGPRAPDPPPGQRLPLPNMFSIVQRVANANPGALRNSCQDQGGSWEFMDLVVDEMRLVDSRFSYNAKRGNFNDPSQDVVFYHWGAGPSEGSTQGYVVDIMLGHCGPSPTPAWIDQTDITFRSNTTGGYMYPRPGRTVLAPDPNRPPLPDRSALVRALGDQHRDLLRNSCEAQGGNWQWLDLVVDRLRQEDPRWGYNGKRGVVSQPAADEISYHWGSDTRQGSTNVYLVDVIESHCGSNPNATWRPFSNEPGAWTSRGRF